MRNVNDNIGTHTKRIAANGRLKMMQRSEEIVEGLQLLWCVVLLVSNTDGEQSELGRRVFVMLLCLRE